MPDIWLDCDANLSEVPVNLMPLIDDTTFKDIEDAVAYNAGGMALRWHFVTTGGAYTVTSVTPTTGGAYDWTDQGDSGIYTIEIPASGGGSINNDTEGFGWFTGKATGILPWRGPVIGFRAAALNDALIDGGDLLDVNVTQFGGTNGTFSGGRPEVKLGDVAHGGTAGTLTLERIIVASATTNEPAMKLTGDGSGAGLYATGGYGIQAVGDTTSGTGIYAIGGSSTGHGIEAIAGLDAFKLTTNDGGDGIKFSGAFGGVLFELPSIPSGWLTATGIASDAFTAAKFASDVTTEFQSGLATAANLATLTAYVDTEVAAILADTNELQTDWANGGRLDLILDARASQTSVDTIDDLLDTEIGTLTTELDGLRNTDVVALQADVDALVAELAKVPKSDSTVTWNATALASINTQVDTALTDIHLDHLLAATYDPASKPGAADALFNELVESDSGVSRFTANALEQAPSGGGGSADWTADEKTAIKAILGIPASGTTPDDPTTGILDTIRDAVGVVDGIVDDILLDTAEIGTAGAGLTNINLPNQTMDIIGNITGNLSGSVGSVTSAITLPTIPADWITAAGLASDVATELQSGLATSANQTTIIGYLDTEVAAILAAVDTEVAAIKAKTDQLTFTVANQVDSNALTLVGTADDAVLAAIAALNNLSEANVRTAVGLATANLDTQLGDLPTAAEVTSAVFAQAIESGVSFLQAQRAQAAVLVGLLADAGENTETYKGIGQASGGTTRVTLTSDTDGNRTGLTLNL